MSFLFWVALIVGGGLFLLSLLGDVFGMGDHGAESFHSDAGDHGEWGRIFSLRNATYFLFAFGAAGVLLEYFWQGAGEPIAFAIAALMGLLAWSFSAMLFSYLRRTDSGALVGDQQLIGRVGQVTLPLTRSGTGKILIARGAQTQEMLARPLDENEAESESWSSVVVVEISDGVALVAPYDDEELT